MSEHEPEAGRLNVGAKPAEVRILRPELMTVPQLLHHLADAFPNAQQVCVVVFDEHGVMRAFRKASNEVCALAGAHLTVQSVTPRIEGMEGVPSW